MNGRIGFLLCIFMISILSYMFYALHKMIKSAALSYAVVISTLQILLVLTTLNGFLLN